MNHEPGEETEATEAEAAEAATEEAAEAEEATEEATEAEAATEASRLAAYDLDGDGRVSPVEDARAALGVLDARLEQIAHDGGVKGKLADAAHHLVDKFDND